MDMEDHDPFEDEENCDGYHQQWDIHQVELEGAGELNQTAVQQPEGKGQATAANPTECPGERSGPSSRRKQQARTKRANPTLQQDRTRRQLALTLQNPDSGRHNEDGEAKEKQLQLLQALGTIADGELADPDT